MSPVGRPREFDTEQALDAAMHLFWRKGYESTSMQDLLDTMGLSKSSLYQTYGDKHKLFQQCIDQYRRIMSQDLNDSLDQSPSGRDFIETLFRSVVDGAKIPDNRIGCLVMNTASEFAQRDPQIAELVSTSVKRFTEIFYNAVKQSQKTGEIPPSKDARRLARYLMSSLSGLNSMIKSGARKNILNDIVAEILHSLE